MTQSDVIAKVIFTGNVNYNQEFSSVSNTQSPAVSTLIELTPGANTITTPSEGSCVGVFMIPPVSNTNSITLKGVSGDTGVVLNPANPSVIGLATTESDFVLTVSTTISNVRLIFF